MVGQDASHIVVALVLDGSREFLSGGVVERQLTEQVVGQAALLYGQLKQSHQVVLKLVYGAVEDIVTKCLPSAVEDDGA